MKHKNHPAIELFSRLFAEVEAQNSPELPSHFVPMSVFIAVAKREGLDVPDNVIEFWEWSQKIGLRKHAERIMKDYHKRHGTDFTPMEKGALRLQRKLGIR